MSDTQLLETQSVSAEQESRLAQAGQVPPPQSTSVSAPFCALSLQVAIGGLHMSDTQLLETQSVFAEQESRLAQAGQVPPPQSTSVSAPFCIPSLQVIIGGTHAPDTQLLETQSVFAEQESRLAQAGQVPPPQSTSVSAPFC